VGVKLHRRLTPDEIAERDNDPAALTRQMYRHPWIAGFVSGGLLATWGVAIGLPWYTAIVTGVLLCILTVFAWRPGGPAQRWRQALRTKDKERFGDKDSWTFTESLRAHPVLFGLVIGGPIILIALLALPSRAP
jgi:hypothetical protein